LNGRNAPLAEINKNSGAQKKNFNEVRPILAAAKCRPVSVVSKNIKVYADMCRLLPGDATQSVVMRLRVVCPSVRFSLRLEYFENNWRPNSLFSLLSLTSTGVVWCNGNTLKIGVKYGWSQMKLIKAAIFLAF